MKLPKIKLFENMSKIKKTIFISVVAVLLLISAFSIFVLIKSKNNSNEIIVRYDEMTDEEKATVDFITAMQDKKYEDNPDYVGELIFDSNLINAPLVQAQDFIRKDGTSYYAFYSDTGDYVDFVSKDNGCNGRACTPNDIYVRMDWQTMQYSGWGSNFIDYRCYLSDKNIIIYGHHVTGANQAFSKLENLLLEGNYENNKTFKLFLNNEQRSYEIVAVYICDIETEDVNYAYHLYMNSNENLYKNSEFNQKYNEFLKNKQLYDTGLSIKDGDNLVTLSTCVDHEDTSNNPKYREIVIARETERKIIK